MRVVSISSSIGRKRLIINIMGDETMNENFLHLKQYHSVLTNGDIELEIYGSRYGCGVNPKEHIFGQDGYVNIYIDGKPANIEIREVINC